MKDDYELRRKDRAVTAPAEMLEIVKECRVCRLGMLDDLGRPYVVPLNFGFDWVDGALHLYFHSARAGKKIDLLKRNPSVFVEMDVEWGMVAGKSACLYGFAYASVMGRGQVEWIEEGELRKHALLRVLDHYTGRSDFEMTEAGMNSVAVYRVTVTEWSGKVRRMP